MEEDVVLRRGSPTYSSTVQGGPVDESFAPSWPKCFLDDITSIYGEAKAQGQTCALGPRPRDARLGELLPGLQDSYHPAGQPVFTLACPVCRGSWDEWGSMVNVPRGITLRPIQGPPGA